MDDHRDTIIAKCQEVSNLSRSLLDSYDKLKEQELSELKPMLNDTYDFDLEGIYKQVCTLQKHIQPHFN